MKEYLISIVIPVFNEGNQIAKNLMAIHDILDRSSIPHEFIVVDDGSNDNTWNILNEVSNQLQNISALRLSRNFGKESALCAGLEVARGDACIVMDADLQHPPEIIPEMVNLWQQEGYEVVEGLKKSRGKESAQNKIGAYLFYKLLRSFSGLDLNAASDFKLMDKKVLSAWRKMNERLPFFRGMSAWLGFKRTSILFSVPERTEGTSKWPVIRLIKLAINAITSFTALPLQTVTIMGLLFFVGAIILGIQSLYMKFKGFATSGFTTVIILQLIIGSVIMMSLGIIGTYIAGIFNEVKNRPRYVISEEIKSGDRRN